MIRPQEIEEKSGQLGVPISAIERDYVQNWILKHLRAIDMVLKGGTGIRKVYIENYRFCFRMISISLCLMKLRLMNSMNKSPMLQKEHKRKVE